MIQEIINDIVKDVQEGHLEALAAYARLKTLDAQVKEAISEVFDLALEEAEQHDKTFKQHGYVFERRNGRRSYSFNHIPEYKEAKAFVKEMEDKYKDAQAQSEKGNTLVDENGEVLPMAKVTYSKDSIIVRKA